VAGRARRSLRTMLVVVCERWDMVYPNGGQLAMLVSK
jgi:hypothetical protein